MLAQLRSEVAFDAAPTIAGPMAAVMVGLVAGEGLETLLIKRPIRDSDPWSGHVAFPGGRAEGNETPAQTAMRECAEEVGFAPEARDLLGYLEPVRAVGKGRVRNLSVVPVVFALREKPAFVLEPGEVAEALWVPIEPLREGLLDAHHPYTHEGVVHHFPAYDIDGRVVWGMTYRILCDFFARLATTTRSREEP